MAIFDHTSLMAAAFEEAIRLDGCRLLGGGIDLAGGEDLRRLAVEAAEVFAHTSEDEGLIVALDGRVESYDPYDL